MNPRMCPLALHRRIRGPQFMFRNASIRFFVLTCCLFVAISGCRRKTAPIAPPEIPAIPISQPVQRVVTDYVDFTGRTNAVESVDVRARVSGYLVKMLSPKLVNEAA